MALARGPKTYISQIVDEKKENIKKPANLYLIPNIYLILYPLYYILRKVSKNKNAEKNLQENIRRGYIKILLPQPEYNSVLFICLLHKYMLIKKIRKLSGFTVLYHG